MSILHKRLSETERLTFAHWARENWEPDTLVSPAYHPAVRAEWHRLDAEHANMLGKSTETIEAHRKAWEDAEHERTLTPKEAREIWDPVARALLDD